MTHRPRCPVCNRPFARGSTAAQAAKDGLPVPVPPFCSQRCKLIDLSRWLGEEYTISSDGDSDGPDTWALDGTDDVSH